MGKMFQFPIGIYFLRNLPGMRVELQGLPFARFGFYKTFGIKRSLPIAYCYAAFSGDTN